MSRLDYAKISPQLAAKFFEFSRALAESSLDEKLRLLVTTRASQLNGCAFCVDMHVKEAKIAGERELRLHHLAIWRESPLFDDREKAALTWTEVLTKLPEGGVSDEIYQSVRQRLSEREIADLTFQIMAINGWTRVNVAFRTEPGSKDGPLGLKKAGLT